MKCFVSKLSMILSSVILCIPAVVFSANKLEVHDNANPSNPKMVVTDTGYVGIGTNDPRFPIHILGNGSSSQTQLVFHNKGRVAVATDDNPAISFFRNNDPSINNGLPRDKDRLGHFTFGSEVSGVKTYIASMLAYAEGDWNTTLPSGYLSFQTKRPGSTYPEERLRITSVGNIGIGTTDPKSKLHVVGIAEYADNAAALAAALTVGAIYRTGDVLKIVH